MDDFTVLDAGGALVSIVFALVLAGVWRILSEIRGHLIILVQHAEYLSKVHKDKNSIFSTVEVIELLEQIIKHLESGTRLDQWAAKVLKELLVQAEVPAAKILEFEEPGG